MACSRRSRVEQEVERYRGCPNGQRVIGAVEDMSMHSWQDRAHAPQVGQLDDTFCTQRVSVSQSWCRVGIQGRDPAGPLGRSRS